MIEREKVLTWLEICGENDDCSGCCPYGDEGETFNCRSKLMTDALALLKEQEAVKPLFNERMKHFVCPNCSLVLDEGRDDYCPSCGKQIAWAEYYIDEDEDEDENR